MQPLPSSGLNSFQAAQLPLRPVPYFGADKGDKKEVPDAGKPVDESQDSVHLNGAQPAEGIDAANGEAPTDNSTDAKAGGPRSQESLNRAKLITFGTVVPLMSCLLYMVPVAGPFLLGPLVGGTIAFLSGRYSRRVRSQMPPEQFSKTDAKVANFINTVSNPDNFGKGIITAQFNELMGDAADARLMGLVKHGGTIARFLSRSRFTSWIVNNRFVQAPFRLLGRVKNLDNVAGVAAKEGGQAVMKTFARGVSINMRIANAETVPGAIFAGLKGLALFYLGPVILAYDLMKASVGGKVGLNKNPDKPSQA